MPKYSPIKKLETIWIVNNTTLCAICINTTLPCAHITVAVMDWPLWIAHFFIFVANSLWKNEWPEEKNVFIVIILDEGDPE